MHISRCNCNDEAKGNRQRHNASLDTLFLFDLLLCDCNTVPYLHVLVNDFDYNDNVTHNDDEQWDNFSKMVSYSDPESFLKSTHGIAVGRLPGGHVRHNKVHIPSQYNTCKESELD